MTLLVGLLLLGGPLAWPATVPPPGEDLQYSINWVSGLSLGEGRIKAAQRDGNWVFELSVEAAVPGFSVTDKYNSTTTPETCSIRFDKELVHGKRRTQERISFDPKAGQATRQTVGGGRSVLTTPACARDALAFVYHLRQELASGRIPKPQDVFYGAAYQVSLKYGGQQKVKVGEAMENADRILVTVKGPASQLEMEVSIGRDAARTPLAVKVPSELGTFTLELVR